MVLKNTLFKKVYFLAGVVMAANIFVVNEMKASNKEDGNEIEIIDEVDQDSSINTGEKASPLKNVLNFVLPYENYINLIGGLLFSGFNNYSKWWDYSPGRYRQFGCRGWRSKSFLNDMLQFDININLGRGISWLIPGIFGLMQFINEEVRPIILSTAGFITRLITMKAPKNEDENEDTNNPNASFCVFYFILFLFQGFVSMPLAIHISNFSIAISLDSIIWDSVAIWARKKMIRINIVELKEKKKDDQNMDENVEENEGVFNNKDNNKNN